MPHPAKVLASCLGVGFLPWAPGTAASVVGVFGFLLWGGNTPLFVFLTALVILVSFGVSPRAEALFGKKDDQRIVIDEVAGQMVGLLFLPVTLGWALWGFILFRFFDIVKPPPIRWLETGTGRAGVTADDLMAGVYTCCILQLARLVM